MAILKKCWCGISVRRGSFFSGFYTLGLYMIMVATGMFHVNLDSQSKVWEFGLNNAYWQGSAIKYVDPPVTLIFRGTAENVVTTPYFGYFFAVVMVLSLLMVMFAGLCIVTSTLLLVGLCVDCGVLLLPWIVSVSMTTSLDVILSFFLLSETDTESVLIVLFIADLLICALNVYCILCVISHYQAMTASPGGVPSRSLQALSFGPETIAGDVGMPNALSTRPDNSPRRNCRRTVSYPKSKGVYGQTGVSLEDISEKPSSADSEDFVSKEERTTCCERENLSVQCPAEDSTSVRSVKNDEAQTNSETVYLMENEMRENHPLLSEQYSCSSSHNLTYQCETMVSLDRISDSVLRHVTQLCKIPTSATCPSILMSSSESDLSPVNSSKLIDSE